MKIKDLIKHLETLDQEKELVIIATDPTDWDYGMVVDENSIDESVIYPSDDNGLGEYFKDEIEMIENRFDEDEDGDEEEYDGIECYVIRMDV
jgi:hypothetical protein